MSNRRSAFAWALAVLCALMTLGALALGVGDGRVGSELLTGDVGFQAVVGLTVPVLGALLITNGHRLGWLFCVVGSSRAVAVAAGQWALHDYRSGGTLPFAGVMAFVSLLALLVGPGLSALTLLWFPDGTLPDHRKRWRLGPAAVTLSFTGLLGLTPYAWSERGVALVDDSAAPNAVVGACLATVVIGALLGLAVGLAALVSRLRGPDPVQRQQTKWYLLGAAAAVVLNLTGDLVPSGGFLNLLGTIALEAAVLVAVRRHALWEVDRLLRRTVFWGLLSAFLVGLYAGVVLGLGLVLERVSHGQSAAVAAAALVAAFLAGPAYRSLQQRVDKQFDRRTHDAVAQVRGMVLPAPEDLQEVLRGVLDDDSLELVFRCGSGELVDSMGRAVPEPHHATEVPGGWVAHRELAQDERRSATRVLEAAADALAYGRLQAELRVQLEVVQQSRRRIVEAADEERRRVERDLHDGAQQRLVALAITLRSEQRNHQLAPEALRIIELGISEIAASVQDLRTLAAGILPGSLVSEGLGAAVRELADRQPQSVHCALAVDHRHDPQIEATAWFVAAEGLANCLKHAPSAEVWLEAECDGTELRVAVRDDGPGGLRLGRGLVGLQDRVGACGGILTVSEVRPSGTQVVAELPCGS